MAGAARQPHGPGGGGYQKSGVPSPARASLERDFLNRMTPSMREAAHGGDHIKA